MKQAPIYNHKFCHDRYYLGEFHNIYFHVHLNSSAIWIHLGMIPLINHDEPGLRTGFGRTMAFTQNYAVNHVRCVEFYSRPVLPFINRMTSRTRQTTHTALDAADAGNNPTLVVRDWRGKGLILNRLDAISIRQTPLEYEEK